MSQPRLNRTDTLRKKYPKLVLSERVLNRQTYSQCGEGEGTEIRNEIYNNTLGKMSSSSPPPSKKNKKFNLLRGYSKVKRPLIKDSDSDSALNIDTEQLVAPRSNSSTFLVGKESQCPLAQQRAGRVPGSVCPPCQGAWMSGAQFT